MAAPSTNGARPWADLPTEMIDAVVVHLDIFSTARLTAVCASWARAVASNTSLPFGTPCFLMSREDEYDQKEAGRESGDDECTFALADLSSAREWSTFPAFIRAVRNRWWVGAKGGWLATVDEHCNAQLVNPYTGDQIDLPAIATIPDVEPVGHYCQVRILPNLCPHTFHRIVICETPSGAGNGDDYLVIAVVTDSLLAIARGGDQSWTALKNPRCFSYCSDAIVHKGKVFAVDGLNANIYAWDLRAGACPEPELLRPPRVDDDDFTYQWRNLAESADGRRLLLACTYGRYVRDDRRSWKLRRDIHTYQGYGVRLYELNVDAAGSDGGGWSRVTSLGDRALFLGANYPFFARVNGETSDERFLQPNCVYFTVNNLFENHFEDYDMVGFNLDDQKHGQMISWCYSNRYCNLQTPMWFRPTL